MSSWWQNLNRELVHKLPVFLRAKLCMDAVRRLKNYRKSPNERNLRLLLAAVEYLKEAHSVFTEKDFPEGWGLIHSLLGEIMVILPAEHPEDNIGIAIEHYNSALRVLTEVASPEPWAMIQYNLGKVYSGRTSQNYCEGLNRGIEYYTAALRVFSKEKFPQQWAWTQHNLASNYRKLTEGDYCENQLKAIACYKEIANDFYTVQRHPVEWALIQNSLGAVYTGLPVGQEEENCRRAIECFWSVIQVCKQIESTQPWMVAPVDIGELNLKAIDPQYKKRVVWVMAHTNLGFAYQRLSTGRDDEYFQKAITSHKIALRDLPPDIFPTLQAKALMHLAYAYSTSPDTVHESIRINQALLAHFSEQDYPYEWSRIQHNLGCDYSRSDNQESYYNSLNCFSDALRVRGLADEQGNFYYPADRLRTLRELSDLHFVRANWEEALSGYNEGLNTLEQLRTRALTNQERYRLLAANIQSADRAIISAYHLKQYTDACVIAERNKTRNLLDALSHRDTRPKNISDIDWHAYRDLLSTLENIEFRLKARHDRNEFDDSPDERRYLHQVRQDLKRYECEFREADEEYLPTTPALDFASICNVVRQAADVLVEFRVTESGTFVFVTGGTEIELNTDNVVHAPELTVLFIQQLMHHWPENMIEILETVGAKLIKVVQERIHTLYPKNSEEPQRLLVVPNKGLNLLPLHSCPFNHDGRTLCWLDLYEVVYAPSMAVLSIALRREEQRKPHPTLFAVDTPDALGERPIEYGHLSVNAVSKHFIEPQILAGSEATIANVLRMLPTGREIMFYCHGTYRPDNVSESCLLLSGTDRLKLSDILQLDLFSSWLVVLSACETAFTDPRDSVDEIQGLHTAFLLAGAPTVVGSLWSVDDLATALLMEKFYENLYAMKMGKAAALKKAQLWLRDLKKQDAMRLLKAKKNSIETSDPNAESLRIALNNAWFRVKDSEAYPFRHPYWWAAFQCMGSG